MSVWVANPLDGLPSEGNRPQRHWLRARVLYREANQTTSVFDRHEEALGCNVSYLAYHGKEGGTLRRPRPEADAVSSSRRSHRKLGYSHVAVPCAMAQRPHLTLGIAGRGFGIL